MRVELLWWEGCPSHPETLADLKRVLREEGVYVDVELVEVESDEQARAERFPGSPTVRIDGLDAVPPGDAEPHSLTCRVYRLRDGRPTGTGIDRTWGRARHNVDTAERMHAIPVTWSDSVAGLFGQHALAAFHSLRSAPGRQRRVFTHRG